MKDSTAGPTPPRTVFRVRVRDCRFTVQAISVEHLFPGPGTVCEEGPLVVSRLNDGAWFVHNGRHRALRALLAGVDELDAVSLYDDDGTAAAALARPAEINPAGRAPTVPAGADPAQSASCCRVVCGAWTKRPTMCVGSGP